MRYLVKARVKADREAALLKAVADGSLGRGSVAEDEYIYDLQHARVGADGVAHWVETCFCATPLAEERPYWEQFFELLIKQDISTSTNQFLNERCNVISNQLTEINDFINYPYFTEAGQTLANRLLFVK